MFFGFKNLLNLHFQQSKSKFKLVKNIIILILIYLSEFRLLIFILYIFLGINNGFFWPSTNSLVAKNAASTRGSAFGLVLLFAHIFAALGPFLDGILLVIDPNKYSLIFFFACLFSLVGALLMLLIKFFLKPDSQISIFILILRDYIMIFLDYTIIPESEHIYNFKDYNQIRGNDR